MNTKMLCLGVLTMGEASGYDIGKQLEQIFGNFIDVASSGVYPALKSLYEEGMVDYTDVLQDSLPNKKLYRITDCGRETFRAALAELPPRHKVRSQFILLLYFAELLSEQRLLEIIDERLAELKGWLQMTENWLNCRPSAAGNPGENFIARYGREIMQTEIRFLEDNKAPLLAALTAEGKSND